ncbi:uncharacterized protein cubi_01518 [Cryptosporidium ubiquitum]|uniref:Protein kinase domain-containing protein n=1 Tax=Cryptosporidium ubiquitum TaxID=857276 RepID=A0A1J4MD79_9CRYT|nr:uncharacterized protein cubi_01518 [Cryptosporidium ubiquitum]OII72185.1 hypothetical protein cubi_01518 [Cryptosporidium ubiquitum]
MKLPQLVLLLLGIFGEYIGRNNGLKVKGGVTVNRGRMLSRGRRPTSPSLNTNRRSLPSRKAYQQHLLEDSMLGGDGSDFISDTTIGGVINDKGIMSKAPSKLITKPIFARIQPEEAVSKVQVIQKTVQRRGGKVSSVVRSISPRRISVIDLNMGPQEMVDVLSREARQMEQDKTGINKGSAELACARYSFMFHCEVVEIPKEVLERRKDKYLYTVRDLKDKRYAWNTAQGTYGRVVFGYIEVPSVDQRFKTGNTKFSEFYKLPETLTGVKVLFHGGGKYPAKYLLPGMKVSVVIKSYFRGIYKIGRIVWNREREILYSLSKEFWTDGYGGPLTHTPTVFSVHYQDPQSGKQQVLFEDKENKRALVSELLIMERITGQTFFEVSVYLQDSKIFKWLEQTNAWELWNKAVYKLQWTFNHILQSFMATGYLLYMHCDLNRSNILLSIPPLTFDHKRNLLNIISMEPWDVRVIDLSFVWVPNTLKSRNTRSICSQVNKMAIFSDANYLHVCIMELFKVPQKDLPISRPTPLYKAVRAKALELWEKLDSVNEWWAVGINFIGRNSSTHKKYKIRKPELGGNTFNECLEGIMMMSDIFDAEARKLGIKLPFHSFSPEAYLRGYLHLSFRITKLGLCLRTKITENWESIKNILTAVTYFDFSVMVLSLDASLSSNRDSNVCKINIPKSEKQPGSHYTTITLSNKICQEIKSCMASVEAMKSIPGDEVIKPAISVVTAENHESDRILNELRFEKKFPESIQALGVRLFGRFQGINNNVDLNKNQILNFLTQLDLNAKIGTIRSTNPSESSLLSVCNDLESNGTLKSTFGAQIYSSIISYAKNYRLNTFCQLLFKQLRNTMLFSNHLDPDFRSGQSLTTPETAITEKQLPKFDELQINTPQLRKEIIQSQTKFDLGRLISKIQEKGALDKKLDEKVYLFSSNKKECIKVENFKQLIGSSKIEVGDYLKKRFIKKINGLIDSVGEQILKYNSIQLLCSSFTQLFECNMRSKAMIDNSKDNYREESILEVNEPGNTQIILWDEIQDQNIQLQWKVLSGKYGSVTFLVALIPKVSSEYLIKSQVMANSCNMPLKIKNIRAWFHGSLYVKPGWVPEDIKLYLAVKSPFKGVHSIEKEIWERENFLSLLLSREIFSMVLKDGVIEQYQLSPSIVTFHHNVKDSNKCPSHFFITNSKKSLIKINDLYRPLFSNYMFMEYINGFPLETILYYLRSEDIFLWLNQENSQKRWVFWLEAILNLSKLVLLSIQSFSSTGFFQYFHCDLNFGNIIILKENISERLFGINKLFQDKNNHFDNLKFIANIGQESIRIIDYAFTYVLYHREKEDEISDFNDFLKQKGIYKATGERNFENICKKMIKAALFNDPNYISILISELLIGHSSLLNKSLLYQNQQDDNKISYSITEINDPSLKWKDQSNQFINLLYKFDSILNSEKEWEIIAQEFVEDESPIKRWISKKSKYRNQRNILSSFNQGSEAYIIACDKLNQIIQVAKKTGLIIHQDLLNNCLSFEFYLRSYLFIPFNIAKIGSCLYSKAKKSQKFASYISSEKSNTIKSFFQMASITISYYIWITNRTNKNNNISSILFDFFHEIKNECNDEQLNLESSEILSNLKNIDPMYEKTKNIYNLIYKDQMEFLNKNIVQNNLSIPFVLLLQRAWYRIQDSTEILQNQIPLNVNENLLNSLIEFFSDIQLAFSNSIDPYQKGNNLHINDSTILNICMNNINHLKYTIFKDSAIGDSDLCNLIIKPLIYTSPFKS